MNLPLDIYKVRNGHLSYIQSISKKKKKLIFNQILSPIKKKHKNHPAKFEKLSITSRKTSK